MQQENIPTSYETAKQIAKQNSKEIWLNDWTTDVKGRRLYQFQNKPNPRDAICNLERRDQCNIFRLRTGHIMLNGHRNRIDPLVPPMCRHCGYPFETVEHHLLYCEELIDLRQSLLPPNPTLENCLFSDAKQLKKTSQYHVQQNLATVRLDTVRNSIKRGNLTCLCLILLFLCIKNLNSMRFDTMRTLI